MAEITKVEEPDGKVKALVDKFAERIKRAEKLNENFEKDIKKYREYQYGKVGADKTGGVVRANLIYSTIATILPHIYAKNPEVSISPNELVAKGQYDMIKKFGKTAEILVAQKLIKEPKMKEQQKANLRSTMVTSVGWIKMFYQVDYAKDPLVQRRIADAQDNLARINALIAIADDATREGHLAAQQELIQQMEAIKLEPEIPIYKGFVQDRIKSEDMLILDDSIDEFHQYKAAKALAHRIWYTADDYEEHFGRKPTEQATPYSKKSPDTTNVSASDKDNKFYCVYEIWDKQSNTVYTWCKGDKDWCRVPQVPEHTPKRWYPFYCLAFNIVEGRWLPLSDVEMLMELQDEYNKTRTRYAEHRDDSMPVRLFRNNGNLTPTDIKSINERKGRDMIGIEGSLTQPLGADIAIFPAIPIDPAVYDVTAIRNDMDLMSGLTDASRGNLMQPKTATEAGILAQNMSSRVDERRDVTEDYITEMLEAGLEIMLQDMTKEEVMKICGEEAVWPEMSREEIYSLVNLSVRGGSTSKPNKIKDQETWTKLLPQIQTSMQTVQQLRDAGHDDMANAVIELLRETLVKFDERIDVESFLPTIDPDDANQQNAQALQQCKAQLQGAMEKIQQYEQEVIPELQDKADGNAVKMYEINTKKDIEHKKMDQDNAREESAVPQLAQLLQGTTENIETLNDVAQALTGMMESNQETQQQLVQLQADMLQRSEVSQEGIQLIAQEIANLAKISAAPRELHMQEGKPPRSEIVINQSEE